MSETCNNNCSSCGETCDTRAEAQTDFTEKLHALSDVKKVIAVVSGKGGVGKSMVTSMLATLAKRMDFSTAILDADITGPSIPKAFGITEKAQGNEDSIFPVRTKTGIDIMSVNLLLENDTDPVIWRGPILAGTVKQFWSDVIWDDIDVMFVDLPPGTGDVPLTVFQSIPIDGIVVVTSPQDLVSMIVGKAVKMAQMMNVPILGLVENYAYFTCDECGKKHFPYGESHIEEIAKKYEIPLTAKLPINTKISAASDAGMIELFEGDWLDKMVTELTRDIETE
ncbi:MAG: Mrp/NBP35 family ATP-binding protein [Eubacteriales bacterium]